MLEKIKKQFDEPEVLKEKELEKKEENRERFNIGTIDYWNEKKGWGEVKKNDKFVFVHCSVIKPSPERGANLTNQKIFIEKVDWEAKKGPCAIDAFLVSSGVINALEGLPENVLVDLSTTKMEHIPACSYDVTIFCPNVTLSIEVFEKHIDCNLQIPLELSKKEKENLEDCELEDEDYERKKENFFGNIKKITERVKFLQSQNLLKIPPAKHKTFLNIFLKEIPFEVSPFQAWETAEKDIFEQIKRGEQEKKERKEKEEKEEKFTLPIEISEVCYPEDPFRIRLEDPIYSSEIKKMEFKNKNFFAVEIYMPPLNFGGDDFDVQEIIIQIEKLYLVCENERCPYYNEKQEIEEISMDLEETEIEKDASIIIVDKKYKPVIKYDKYYSIEEIPEFFEKQGLGKCHSCGKKQKFVFPSSPPKIIKKKEPYGVEL